MNKLYFCWYFHKCLKNTIDLLLFYEEHFHEFSESVTGNLSVETNDTLGPWKYPHLQK